MMRTMLALRLSGVWEGDKETDPRIGRGRMGGRRVRVRGGYRFVESLTLLSQRLNARGGRGRR
jgi:hypothetical protein